MFAHTYVGCKAKLKVIKVREVLFYVAMTAASLLFICMGAIMLFASQKFVEFGHWWGKQIGFPRYSGKWEYGNYLSYRLPGLFALCFGTFMLFSVLRSLLH
jgi:hypothetical protein